MYPYWDKTRDIQSNVTLFLKEGKGLYLTVYPLSRPNTDTLYLFLLGQSLQNIGIILSFVTQTSDLKGRVLKTVLSINFLFRVGTLLLQSSFMVLLPSFQGNPFGAFLNASSWLMAIVVKPTRYLGHRIFN